MGPRPHVTVHVAQSLDGRVALEGSRTLLSTREGLTCAHAARAEHDAILVGASTIRIDDPLLTVRHAPGKSPLRIVLASTLVLPEGARVLDGDAEGRALVIGAEGRASDEAGGRLRSRGIVVAVAPRSDEGQVSIDGALAILAAHGVKRLLVEGGAKVVTSFLKARRVDRVSIEIAMRFLGAPGTPTLGAIAVGALGEAPSLANVLVERLGDNVIVRGDVVYA